MHYPIMLNLTNQKITIVGGGKVAYRKATHFLDFEGDVTVVSEHFISEFREISSSMRLIEATYKADYLEGSFIVVAATDNKLLNTQIGTYCKVQGILCNIASNPDLSSFIVPSFIKRGELVISISTGGNSPALARKIKKELENKYTPDYGEYVNLLGDIREHIIHQNLNEVQKREVLNNLLEMSSIELNAYLQGLNSPGRTNSPE